jgi:hypothetical protein
LTVGGACRLVEFASAHGFDEFPDGVRLLERVAQRLPGIDAVVIPASRALARQHLCLLEIMHNALYSAFRDADFVGDIAQPHMRVAGQADEHVAVVAQQGPGGTVIHRVCFDGLEKNKNTTIFTGNQFRI